MHRGILATAELPEGRASNTSAVIRRLWRYVAPYRRVLLAAVGLMGVAAVAAAAGPFLIGLAVDDYIEEGDPAGLALVMVALLLTYAVTTVARVAQFRLTGWVTQNSLADLRASIFDAVKRQSIRFFEKREIGDLMSRLVNDVEVINNVLAQGMVQAFSGLFGLVAIVAAMLLLDLQLALASFVVLPAMFFTTRYFSDWARRAFRRTRETIGDVSANLQEDISGIKVAQVFNRTELNRSRFAVQNAANRDANVEATAVTAAFFPAMDVLSAVAVGIVAGYGGYLAIEGRVTVGVVIAFLGYVQQFFMPIQQVAQMYTQSQSALAGAERIFDLIDTPVDLRDAPDAVELGPIQGRLEFRDVSFSYDEGHPVLDRVSFVVEPGQTVALVGATGAGKTTIANLIARFYVPDSGAILVDGVDIAGVTAAGLRRQMGIVPQNSFLFAASVAENIRYGRLSAGDEDVAEAARLVNADSFIRSLPEGYATVLGEKGATISQGQRQLIAFARAVIADPRILILDEATSSVDTRTEAIIQRAVGVLLRGRTSIVIAHRLSTVRDADLVLVIEDGRVVERGTHVELLGLGGAYADLYRRQFRDRRDGASVPLEADSSLPERTS